VQREQRTQALPGFVVVNEIERDLNPPVGLGQNLFLDERNAGVEGLAQCLAQDCRTIEDFPRVQPQNAALLNVEEAARRR
jgi:hypothetical protein